MTNSFAETLRRRREELGMTQREVGRASGVSAEAISLFESGKRTPQLDRVPRLAAALQLDEATLCRQALEHTAPIFYGALTEEDLPARPGAGEDRENRVVVEIDREGAYLVRLIGGLDSRTRHHVAELVGQLAQANGKR